MDDISRRDRRAATARRLHRRRGLRPSPSSIDRPRAPPALLPRPLGRVVHAQVLVGALRVRGEDGRDGLGDERLRLSERLEHVPPDLAKRHSVSGFLFRNSNSYNLFMFFVHVPPDLVGRQHEALERERLRELAVREHALEQATPHIC